MDTPAVQALWLGGLLAVGAVNSAAGQATTAPAPAVQAPAYKQPRELDAAGRVLGPGRAGWWNDAVFYEVFVRSFMDSAEGPLANDGVGDIPGLISKLDYLNDGKPGGSDLGVTGIWLMPIHPSPSYHGYDITDYYGINKDYGTAEDFRTLVRECHARGIRVIIDLVLNHCSDQHPWFVEAADAASPKHGWFIWADEDPRWKGPWGQTVWHRLKRPGGGSGGGAGGAPADPPRWYYGLFSHRMPDLNYRDDAVSAEMLDVVRFWLREPRAELAASADGPGDHPGGGMGVDGLRLDAIRHLVEDGRVQENTAATHAWLRAFRAESKKARPDAMSIGEVWSDSATAASYVGDQLDLAFEFELASAMIDSVLAGDAGKVRDAQEKVLRLYPPGQYGRFLTNHDQTRAMTRLSGDEAAMRAAAAVMLLGPGVPFVYYGEELGLTGDKPDERLRTPMPWGAGPNAGFSAHKPWQNLAPNPQRVNVEREAKEGASLLNWYRALIALRTASPALRHGAIQHVRCNEPGVYAFLRHAPAGAAEGAGGGLPNATAESAVLVVVNLSKTVVDEPRFWADGSALRGVYHASDALGGWSGEPFNGLVPDLDADNPRGAFIKFVPAAKLEGRGVRAYVLTRAGAR